MYRHPSSSASGLTMRRVYVMLRYLACTELGELKRKERKVFVMLRFSKHDEREVVNERSPFERLRVTVRKVYVLLRYLACTELGEVKRKERKVYVMLRFSKHDERQVANERSPFERLRVTV